MEELSSEEVFRNRFIGVSHKRFRRADGDQVERDVVEHPGSVAILAHDDAGVYLVSQPREAVDDDALLEIPAGTLDVPGESPLDCAKRELSEEVGLRAERWSHLQTLYPSPGFLAEVVTVFEATGLSPQPGTLDEDETIEVVKVPLDEIEPMLGELRDATTLVALLLLLRR